MPIRKNGLVLIAPALLLALSFQTGCATKKYVKQQIDPVSGRVDELSEVSKRNETAIKDVDSRTQAGIQTVQTKTNEVDQKAATATQKAEESQQLAQNNQTKINTNAHGYCQERSNRGYQNSIFMKDLTMKFYPQQESLFHSRTLAPVVATLIPIPVLDTGH